VEITVSALPIRKGDLHRALLRHRLLEETPDIG
jgi:hypothetical protein